MESVLSNKIKERGNWKRTTKLIEKGPFWAHLVFFQLISIEVLPHQGMNHSISMCCFLKVIANTYCHLISFRNQCSPKKQNIGVNRTYTISVKLDFFLKKPAVIAIEFLSRSHTFWSTLGISGNTKQHFT